MRRCLLALALLAAPPAMAPATADGQDRANIPGTGIHVTGIGRVAAPPDSVAVEAGVSSTAPTAEGALSQTSTTMARLMTTLEDAGVAPADIQTIELSLTPDWRHSGDGRSPAVQGYTATNRLQIQLGDIAALGPLLAQLSAAGANRIDAVRFTLQDAAPLEAEARRRAIDDATLRAETYAAAAGLSLGPVLAITEGAASHPGAARALQMELAAAPVAPGALDLTATVTVRFALKN